MVDIVVTASAVIPGSDSIKESGTAGATITAGQVVYKNSTTGKYDLADNNSATAEVRSPRGIALNNASDGQPLTIHRSGDLTMNAVLAANTDYYLSDTPGGIGPQADLAVGEYAVLIGIAKSTTVLKVHLIETGVSN